MTRRILVTRPNGQAGDLADHLRHRGFAPAIVPTVRIEVAPAADLDAVLRSLEGADWLVVTSANGAQALAERLAGMNSRLPHGLRVAAVGPVTADALRAAGIPVDHVPDEYLTLAIADGLGDVAGRRIVLVQADAAAPDLRDTLVDRGALVEEVLAYRTVEGPGESRDPLHAVLQQELAGVAFTSGSTVRGLTRLASPIDRGRARALLAFCIGPVTAAEARKSGFHIAVIAAEHTAAGLAEAIAEYFAGDDQ